MDHLQYASEKRLKGDGSVGQKDHVILIKGSVNYKDTNYIIKYISVWFHLKMTTLILNSYS